MQKGVFFTHEDKDGDEAVHKTLERLKVEFTGKEKNGVKVEKPEKVRDMGCYKISLDKENLPKDDKGKPKIKIEEFGEYAVVNV